MLADVAQKIQETDRRGPVRVIHHTGGIDGRLEVEDALELVVQVNGKTRGKVSVPRDVTQDTAFAAVQGDAALAKFLTGAPKKVIFVPGRLINIVL